MANKRRKKFFNRELILEKLIELGSATAEYLLNVIYNLPEVFSKSQGLRWQPKRKFRFDAQSLLAWRSMISKLKREALIHESADGKLEITKEGSEYANKYPSWTKSYQVIKNTNQRELILVIFDIPERLRAKRDWIRFHLRNMDFMPLQRSVWYGNNILPRDFIEDLNRYGIFSYIHILSVNKKGSISEWLKRIGKHDLAE